MTFNNSEGNSISVEEVIAYHADLNAENEKINKQRNPGCFHTFLVGQIGISLSSLPYLIAVDFDLTRFDLFDLFFYTWLTFVISGIAYTVYEEKNSKK